MLPSGIVVSEDEDVTIELGSGFPPAAETDYTIATQHNEADVGLISGEAMTYYVTAALLTEQPSDGVILGWIRHPGGSVPLAQNQITNAPTNKPTEMVQSHIARQPFRQLPPRFLVPTGTYPADASMMEGKDSRTWRGFDYALTGGSGFVEVISYISFPVYAEPWEINLESIVPLGCIVQMTLFDTAGSTVDNLTITPHATYQTDTLAVTPGANTWTTGGRGLLQFGCQVARGTTIQFSELEVDFWPYAFPRIS
jgi:hypothetical protein